MGLDLIFAALVVWYAFKGYKKGIVQVLISAVAVVIALLGALKLSGKIATYFFNNDSSFSPWIPIVSFLIVFSAILFLFFMVGKTIDSSLKKVKLGGVNRIAGALTYIVMVCFVFSTFLWIVDKVHLIKPETQQKSISYAIIAPIAPAGFDIIGKMLPFVKSSYAELESLFDKVNNSLP